MIHLFAGGKSALKHLNEPLDGLKVVINFGYRYCDNFDYLIWGDVHCGHQVGKDHPYEAPPFKCVCSVRNEGLAKRWVSETFEYPYGCFTIVWAIMWLKEKFPDEEIIVYGLDGGYEDYYDDVTKTTTSLQMPIERVKIINRCYEQLDTLPCGKDGIYNGNPESAYKGFPTYAEYRS